MMNTEPHPAFAPMKLGPIELRNRGQSSNFEGMAIDNMVTDALIDFHKAFGEGRIGMTTLAYCAVSPDGQGAPNEIVYCGKKQFLVCDVSQTRCMTLMSLLPFNLGMLVLSE